MKKFLATAILGVSLLVSLAGAAVGPLDVKLMCVREEHEFTLKMAGHRYIAVHFVPNPDDTEVAKVVKEYDAKGATVAGVFHVFVSTGDTKALKPWGDGVKDHGIMVACDVKGALGMELKVPEDALKQKRPVTIILDSGGKELARHVGANEHDLLNLAGLRALIEPKWKAPVGEYNLPGGQTVAVQGYDVVSYIESEQSVKGRPEITSVYRGVTYQFSSDANRKLFAANPEKYLPTYGGWCATAMGAKGEKVEIDPTNFKVRDGRLFLFYKSFFSDAKKDWNKHEVEYEPAADTSWKGISGEEPVKPTK